MPHDENMAPIPAQIFHLVDDAHRNVVVTVSNDPGSPIWHCSQCGRGGEHGGFVSGCVHVVWARLQMLSTAPPIAP